MRKRALQKGFTLVELITAVALFTVVMTVSMGSILGIFSANRQSRSLRAVMTNLNLALESMSKEMRYGKTYHCGSSGTLTDAQNCASGDTLLSFRSSEDVQITYRLNGTTLEKDEDGGGFEPVTAPDVVIDSLVFYALGAGTGDTLQPRVLVKLQGHAGDKNRSDFTLQTLISQRAVDL